MKLRTTLPLVFGLSLCAASSLTAASLAEFPAPRPEAPASSAFYGFAEGRDAVAGSSWFAHTSTKLGQHGLGHATFFEEHPDFFRIRLGHPTNFHRSYLPVDKSVEVPGLTGPGRIIARIRRDALSEEVKFVVFGNTAFGVRVSRNEITDLYGEGKLDWDYGDAGWHDWIFEIGEQGTAEFRIDDGPSLKLNPRPDITETLGKIANYVTLGHQRRGPQRFLDVAELHFLAPGQERPPTPASNLPEADFVLRYSDGSPYVVGRTDDGKLTGWVETYWPGGIRASAGSYHQGEKTGVWSYWTQDGRFAATETYRDGILDGQLTLFPLVPEEESKRVGEYREGRPVSERLTKP